MMRAVWTVLRIVSLPRLTHLSVQYASSSSEALFCGLVRHGAGIMHLSLNPRRGEVSAEAALALCRALPQLRVLDADYSEWLSNAVLQALAENCPHLTEVHMSGMCNVTQEGVWQLAQGCAALRTVYVGDAHSEVPRVLRLRMQQLRPALRFVEKPDYPAEGVGFWWDLLDVTREVDVPW
jgi:hypothetical protein